MGEAGQASSRMHEGPEMSHFIKRGIVGRVYILAACKATTKTKIPLKQIQYITNPDTLGFVAAQVLL